MGVENIKLKPSDAAWGNQEMFEVETVADVADALDGTYFTFDTPSTPYHVWMDGVAAADPAPAGRTAIPVAYTTGDSAAVIAGLIVTEVDAVSGVNAKIDPDDATKVRIQSSAVGVATDAVDVDTTFTIAVLIQGSNDDLGLLDGDIEASYEEQVVDITAHQKGAQIINALRNGKNIDLTINIKEVSIEKLKLIFGSAAGGAEVTPGGGTEVFGWGEGKRFTSVLNEARKLVLHPIANAAGDLTEDLAFWSAYPLPDSITYSGENPAVVAVTFRIFPLDKIDDDVNFFIQGDHTQNLLK